MRTQPTFDITKLMSHRADARAKEKSFWQGVWNDIQKSHQRAATKAWGGEEKPGVPSYLADMAKSNPAISAGLLGTSVGGALGGWKGALGGGLLMSLLGLLWQNREKLVSGMTKGVTDKVLEGVKAQAPAVGAAAAEGAMRAVGEKIPTPIKTTYNLMSGKRPSVKQPVPGDAASGVPAASPYKMYRPDNAKFGQYAIERPAPAASEIKRLGDARRKRLGLK